MLYGQFESADRQMRDLVTRAIQDRSALIADAIAPKLRSDDRSGRAALNDDLAKYASDGTILKLMFQPNEERHAGRFYFVASAPQLAAGDRVQMDFYQSTTVSMASPEDPGAAETTVLAGRAPEGATPGAMAAVSTSLVVTLSSYDAKSGLAIFRTPDGLTRRAVVQRLP